MDKGFAIPPFLMDEGRRIKMLLLHPSAFILPLSSFRLHPSSFNFGEGGILELSYHFIA
jgi:hypothetical protein